MTCNAGVSCKVLSRICGNWYFPRFLLSEGSLTCINMASLMFLEEPCVLQCMILKHSGLGGCLIELVYWRRGIDVFFDPFSQSSA